MSVKFIYHKPKCYVLRASCFVFLFFIVGFSLLFFNNLVAKADDTCARLEKECELRQCSQGNTPLDCLNNCLDEETACEEAATQKAIAAKCQEDYDACMYICPVESDTAACKTKCKDDNTLCLYGETTSEIPATDNGTSQNDTATGKLENLAGEKGIGMGIFSTPKQLGPELVLPAYLGTLVFGAMSILGVIFFGLVVYGGFLWLYAGGNDEQVTKAKKIITRALIGLLVVIFAGAITQFVMYYGAR